MKILYLDNDIDDFGEYFRKQRSKYHDVDCEKIYIKNSLVKKIFLFLGLHISAFFLYFSYGKWKKNYKDYDYIIVPSRKTCEYALKILKNKKVIVYYWNIITQKELDPLRITTKYKNVFACSFDKNDAVNHSIAFVDTYYFEQEIAENSNLSDLFYVGIIRPDRKKIIDKFKESFKDTIKFESHLMNYNDSKNRLKYYDIIKKNNSTKCILDLTRSNQSGLTLRPLEALFLKKKLITNNMNIVNYSFYNKNNIFIIGVDDWEEIPKFINSPYQPIDKSVIDYYTFNNWLDRVIKAYNAFIDNN